MDTALQMAPLVLEALESLPDGISIYSADGRPLFFNATTKRRFPYLFEAFEKGIAKTAEEAQRYSVRKTLTGATDEEVNRIADYFSQCMRDGTTYEVPTPNGERVQIRFRELSEGRRVAISVDVSTLREREKELKKARQAAEQASKAKSSFLANMSHEIRTPLNGILGMAQVLEMESLTPTQGEHVQTILESGKNLMSLLNDVLDLSKIEAGKIEIAPTDASPHHTLRRQLKLWKPRAEEKGLELTLAFDAELPDYLSFDTVRVNQCVSNLISNAIKFTTEGSVEVFVSNRKISDSEHLVSVRVKDTGPGMNEETMSRLFKPFVQEDESITRKFGGTGLGLSITRRLAQLMGGDAVVESTPGRGSVFTISFRAMTASRGRETAGQSTVATDGVRDALRQSNLRVLLVDDQPINRQVVTLFLRPFNMRIVEATNGREALEAIQRETFDIVLLDMHMPIMDGPTAISLIRASDQIWCDTPVIALTADAMSGDRERYLAMGMDGYLAKPLAERELISEIARVRNTSPDDLRQARWIVNRTAA